MDDQRAVIAFLSDGASYGKPGLAIERLETHISMVFLAGDRAYKLKRAVRFSYLDYSSVAQRGKFCKAELALNRRTAPQLYLGVRAITRDQSGALRFDGEGEIIDWVLEMRRFEQAALFDRMAEAHKLTPELMRELTDAIASFHAAAEATPGYGGRAGTEETIAGNTANLLAACPPLDTQAVRGLDASSKERLLSVAAVLDRRREEGKVRRCHGDLHLRNVCLFEGRPTPFDCIEFNDALSCIDVLYDLAFLLMDLVQRDAGDLASVVFNRYLDLTGDDGLAVLPLFMSMRAAVRALVTATENRQHPEPALARKAQAYLALARTLLRRHPPRLIAIGGLSGTGKSTSAQTLAGRLPPPPGARVVRSDVLRKRMFQVAPETRLPPAAYTKDVSERVYAALYREVAVALEAGFTAIADAAFLRPDEREKIAEVARRAGVPFVGIWLEAPEPVLAARIETRARDASDADARVLRQQLALDLGRIDWRRVDAVGAPSAYLAEIEALIQQSGACIDAGGG